MGGKDEVAVFTDTSLGTSLAMAVSPDITAADFKRVLGIEHISCFPLLGVIKVEGLMVKRKSHFYYLPDSFPMKHVFQGQQGAWFLHAEVRTLDCSDMVFARSNVAGALVRNLEQEGILYEKASEVPYGDDREWRKDFVGYQSEAADKLSPTATKEILNVMAQEDSGCFRSKNEVLPAAEENGSLQVKTPAKSSSSGGNSIQARKQIETLTNDHSSTAQIDDMPQFMVQTPPQDSSYRSATAESYGTSESKSSKSDVGKRLVMAASNLRAPTNKYRSAVLFGRSRERELSRLKIPSLARFLVFEVSKSDG